MKHIVVLVSTGIGKIKYVTAKKIYYAGVCHIKGMTKRKRISSTMTSKKDMVI